jgi:hypothetical protein
MAETEQQGAVERRVQGCLAKAAYCEWAESVTGDSQLKEFYRRLSSEWQKEAQEAKGQSCSGQVEENMPLDQIT